MPKKPFEHFITERNERTMTDLAPQCFRMSPWKWSLRSAAWAVPVGMVFAVPVGFAVMLAWALFCIDTFGPDPVEHPIPQWRKDLGNVVVAPGMATLYFYPKNAFAKSGLLIQRGTESFVFGFPYAWSFFFLLFTVLGFTTLNREPRDFKNTEQSE